MTDMQKWQMLALVLLLGALLYLLAPVLTPFAVSALFAYLGDPLVDRLERRGLSRTSGVAIVFGLMLVGIVGVVLLLVPMLESQVRRLVDSLPRYAEWFRESALPWLEARIGMDLSTLEPAGIVDALREHWQEAGGLAASLVGGISRSGLAILGWVANLVLVPVVTFYLMRDWDALTTRIRELLPRSIEGTVSRLASQADEVLGAFLRGQLSVMLALGTVYSIGLWAIGIDLALLIGMLAGLVSFVPYLGVFVGGAAAVIAALVQYGDIMHPLLAIGVFAIGQTLEGFVLTPWLVGDRIGLHPVAVIFAIMAGGQLFGFLGVLLALPVAAVAMVVLRYLHDRYTRSGLYAAGAGTTHEEGPAPPASAPADLDTSRVVAQSTADADPADGDDSGRGDSERDAEHDRDRDKQSGPA